MSGVNVETLFGIGAALLFAAVLMAYENYVEEKKLKKKKPHDANTVERDYSGSWSR